MDFDVSPDRPFILIWNEIYDYIYLPLSCLFCLNVFIAYSYKLEILRIE